MGAWGLDAFANDDGCDWTAELEEADDLAPVEQAFADLEAEDDYLDLSFAYRALAACETLARLRGRPGYTNAYTEPVDKWVAAHPQQPSDELIQRGSAAIDRVLGENSEARGLWEDAGRLDDWKASVEDLRTRMTE